jgi:hypothetical protein
LTLTVSASQGDMKRRKFIALRGGMPATLLATADEVTE